MAARRTPEERADANKTSVKRIRRKYKVALNKKKVYAPGEREHLADMVIVLKLGGYSNNQIGSSVGISRGQVKELLDEPKTAERLTELRRNLPGAALDLLHGYSIEAVQAIADVMRGTEDDGLILKAAAEILDRVGIGKVSKSQSEIHNTNENKLTVGAEEGLLESLRQLPPDQQEEAAVMIENLEQFITESVQSTEEEE
jgi:hypothetical protein